jgi:hypothetical protein
MIHREHKVGDRDLHSEFQYIQGLDLGSSTHSFRTSLEISFPIISLQNPNLVVFVSNIEIGTAIQ